MRNYSIEEAIIVATYEHEPKFPIETVIPEPIYSSKDNYSSGGFFEDLFGFFGFDNLFGEMFGFNDSDYSNSDSSSNVSPDPPEPETAIITDTIEQRVEEIHFAYYEFID